MTPQRMNIFHCPYCDNHIEVPAHRATHMLERFIALADELEDRAKAEAATGTERWHFSVSWPRNMAKRIREIAEGES